MISWRWTFSKVTSFSCATGPLCLARELWLLFCWNLHYLSNRICPSFSWNFFLQILVNAVVKNSLCCPFFFKTLAWMTIKNFLRKRGKLLFSYPYCTGPCKNILKISVVGTCFSWNGHWSKIFRSFFSHIATCQIIIVYSYN